MKQAQTTKNQVLETANDIMKYKNIWNEEENQNDKKSKVKGMKIMIILLCTNNVSSVIHRNERYLSLSLIKSEMNTMFFIMIDLFCSHP